MAQMSPGPVAYGTLTPTLHEMERGAQLFNFVVCEHSYGQTVPGGENRDAILD